MYLTELFDVEYSSYQNKSKDNSTLRITDDRKTKLTLAQINRLRKMNDLRKYEYKKNLAKIRLVYAPPAKEGGFG